MVGVRGCGPRLLLRSPLCRKNSLPLLSLVLPLVLSRTLSELVLFLLPVASALEARFWRFWRGIFVAGLGCVLWRRGLEHAMAVGWTWWCSCSRFGCSQI